MTPWYLNQVDRAEPSSTSAKPPLLDRYNIAPVKNEKGELSRGELCVYHAVEKGHYAVFIVFMHYNPFFFGWTESIFYMTEKVGHIEF